MNYYDDYTKATGDDLGEMELLLIYIESGTDFTCSYGDVDERFYDSLISTLDSFSKKLATHIEYLDKFKDRLIDLQDRTSGIGWGYGDYVGDTVFELLNKTKKQ